MELVSTLPLSKFDDNSMLGIFTTKHTQRDNSRRFKSTQHVKNSGKTERRKNREEKQRVRISCNNLQPVLRLLDENHHVDEHLFFLPSPLSSSSSMGMNDFMTETCSRSHKAHQHTITRSLSAWYSSSCLWLSLGNFFVWSFNCIFANTIT